MTKLLLIAALLTTFAAFALGGALARNAFELALILWTGFMAASALTGAAIWRANA